MDTDKGIVFDTDMDIHIGIVLDADTAGYEIHEKHNTCLTQFSKLLE